MFGGVCVWVVASRVTFSHFFSLSSSVKPHERGDECVCVLEGVSVLFNRQSFAK